MTIFTYTMSGAATISIVAADGVNQISIQAKASGSCQITGSMDFKGLASTPVVLSDGQSLTLTSSPNAPLDGVSIDWLSGDVDIVIGA